MTRLILVIIASLLPGLSGHFTSNAPSGQGIDLPLDLTCDSEEEDWGYFPWSVSGERDGDTVLLDINLEVDATSPGLRSVALDLDLNSAISTTGVKVLSDSSWCFVQGEDCLNWSMDCSTNQLHIEANITPCEFRKGDGTLLQIQLSGVPTEMETDSVAGNLGGILHVDNL